MSDAADAGSTIGDDLLRRLDEAWRPARAAGVVGPSSVRRLYEHALGFVLDSWREPVSARFIDCGAGAGVVGILLSLELPQSRWTLVDASERRCELARRAVAALDLGERVRVEHGLLEDLARRLEFRERSDGGVARLFGPASELAECGLPLLKTGSSLVVSVSEKTEREWEDLPLSAATGCEVGAAWSTSHGRYVSVRRVAPAPARLPRRRAARRRAPLGGGRFL